MGDESGSDWDSISEPPQGQIIPIKEENEVKLSNGVDISFDFSNEINEKKHNNDQPIIPGRNRPRPVDAYLPKRQPSESEFTEIGKKGGKNKHPAKNLGPTKFISTNNNIGSPQSNSTSRLGGDSESVVTAVMKNQLQDISGNKRLGSDGSLMGLDNPAFQDISYSIEEKGSPRYQEKSPKRGRKPKADELIKLIHFDPPVDGYFSVKEDHSGALADNFNLKVIRVCDRLLSEISAVLKIPFIIIILIIGHIIGLVLKGFLHPMSDHILKPFLAAAHNHLCVPIWGFIHNSCQVSSHAISPFFKMVSTSCRKEKDSSSSLKQTC